MKKLFLLIVLLNQLAYAQQLRIATYQYADNPRVKNLEPLAAHLQKISGHSAEVKSYPTVQLFIQAIQNGEVDLGFINSFGYLLLETSNKSYPMKPVLAMITPDSIKGNYKTAFVVSATSTVKSWEDVKKYAGALKLALVFSTSTSGNLVPRLGLTNLGINNAERSFKEVKYVGTHANAIAHVLQDSSDIAAMGSAEYDKLSPEQQGKLRLIWLSPEIPLGPALISTKLNKEVQQLLSKELLSLHQTNGAAFTSLKSAWSESRTASQFITITNDYYLPFLERFGSKKDIYPILQQFAN